MTVRSYVVAISVVWLAGCVLPPAPQEGAPVVDQSVRPTPGSPPPAAPQVEVQRLSRPRPLQPQQSTEPAFDPSVPGQQPGGGPVADQYQVPAPQSPSPSGADLMREGNQAVVALLDSAANHVADQEWDKAAAALERALRIEPGNASIWHDLAQIRLQQRQYEQASSLAAKSNSLAANNQFVRIRNWRLISVARRALGDEAGADAAEAQALALER